MPYPLVKLPEETEQTLLLIKEELKSRKLFQALHQAGLEDCYWQPHLDTLILKSIGLHNVSDKTFRRYDNILEKRSKKIHESNDSIMKQAMKVYFEILEVKKEVGEGEDK